MKNSRLWKLLRTFSKKELREVEKFVASPFYNQREDVTKLYETLVNWSDKTQSIPDKMVVFKKIYPKETYDVAKIHLISSILYKVMEDYLTQRAFFADKTNAKIVLAASYRKLRLEDHFKRTIEEAQALHRVQEKNVEYYDAAHQLLMEEYNFANATQRMEEYNLQDISDNIDLAFLARKLRQSCLLLSHQAVYNKTYDFGLQDTILRYVEENEKVKVPVVLTYYYCYKTLRDKKEVDFIDFQAILSEHSSIFPKNEARDLYLAAINFCIKKMNQEETAYINIGLDIYKETLEKDILLENGRLSRFAFNNIVSMAVTVRDFDWIERFIHQYTPNLELAFQESIPSFSLAKLNYEKGNLDRAMMQLQKADYTDLLMNLSAKTLLAKIYYELDEFDLISSHLTAMKMFVERHKKVLGYHFAFFTNVVKYMQKILNVNNLDKKAVAKLVNEITTEKTLMERKWMLKMLGN